MAEYAREEVKYRLATLNNEVGEMALTYIHELEQINSRLREENKKLLNGDIEKHNQIVLLEEIIRKYYKYNPSCEYSYEDIDKEAEQFFKESEQWKNQF